MLQDICSSFGLYVSKINNNNNLLFTLKKYKYKYYYK